MHGEAKAHGVEAKAHGVGRKMFWKEQDMSTDWLPSRRGECMYWKHLDKAKKAANYG